MCICLNFLLIFEAVMLHNYQSMNKTIVEIFKIDKVGKGIAVKILFVFLVMLRICVNLFPIGDSNFDPLISFYNDFIENPNMVYSADFDPTLPVSMGNLLYIFSLLLVDFSFICGYFIYVGMMIRSMRIAGGKLRPISVSSLILRLFVLTAVAFICYFPAYVAILLLYFFIIFIIIFPWLFMFPACYLSGDSGFFMSIAETFRKSKGYYVVNVRNLAIIMLASMLLQLVSLGVGGINEAVGVVLDAFISVFTMFCIARYSCLIYNVMILSRRRVIHINR